MNFDMEAIKKLSSVKSNKVIEEYARTIGSELFESMDMINTVMDCIMTKEPTISKRQKDTIYKRYQSFLNEVNQFSLDCLLIINDPDEVDRRIFNKNSAQ